MMLVISSGLSWGSSESILEVIGREEIESSPFTMVKIQKREKVEHGGAAMKVVEVLDRWELCVCALIPKRHSLIIVMPNTYNLCMIS